MEGYVILISCIGLAVAQYLNACHQKVQRHIDNLDRIFSKPSDFCAASLTDKYSYYENRFEDIKNDLSYFYDGPDLYVLHAKMSLILAVAAANTEFYEIHIAEAKLIYENQFDGFLCNWCGQGFFDEQVNRHEAHSSGSSDGRVSPYCIGDPYLYDQATS